VPQTTVTTVPSFEQVAALPAITSTVVPQEYVDFNGHMNVLYHLQLDLQGCGQVFQKVLSVNDVYRAETGNTIFTAEHHLRYYAEARLGEKTTTHARMIGRSDKVFHLMVFLLNHDTQQLVNTLEATLIHVNLHSRRPTPMPNEVVAAIDTMIEQGAGLGWEAPVCGSMGPRR